MDVSGAFEYLASPDYTYIDVDTEEDKTLSSQSAPFLQLRQLSEEPASSQEHRIEESEAQVKEQEKHQLTEEEKHQLTEQVHEGIKESEAQGTEQVSELFWHKRAQQVRARTIYRLYAGADGRCPVCLANFHSRLRVISHLRDARYNHKCREAVLAGKVPQLSEAEVDLLDALDRAKRREARRTGHTEPLATQSARSANGKPRGRPASSSVKPGKKPDRRRASANANDQARHRLVRKSRLGQSVRAKEMNGMSNISYHWTADGWQVKWKEGKKYQCQSFLVKDFGTTEKAMDAALECRSILVKRGVIDESRSHQTPIRGVEWSSGAWIVCTPNTGASKRIAARFAPVNQSVEEIAKARLFAMAKRKQLERACKAAQKMPGTSKPVSCSRQSGVPGITWDRYRARWLVNWRQSIRVPKEKYALKRVTKAKSVRPKDDSPEEVEHARKAAVRLLHSIKGGRCSK